MFYNKWAKEAIFKHFWLLCCLKIFVFQTVSGQKEIVDLLNHADLISEPFELKKVPGRCFSNNSNNTIENDFGFKLSDKSQILLSTNNLFPHGFPKDFSILFVTRVFGPGNPIFTIYSENGDEQLALTVGQNEVTLLYEDQDGLPEDGNLIPFDIPLNINEWHRLAFSVKGDSVTLISNCQSTISKKLARKPSSTLTTSGIITMGHELIGGGFYNVKYIPI